MRKTKIVCTLGPATDNEDVLRKLMLAGMNVARLNFSHGTHEEQKKRMDMVKKLRAELGLPIAILLDTKGPEIRTRDFEGGKAELKAGDFFTLTTRDLVGDSTITSITYKDLYKDVQIGTHILITLPSEKKIHIQQSDRASGNIDQWRGYFMYRYYRRPGF